MQKTEMLTFFKIFKAEVPSEVFFLNELRFRHCVKSVRIRSYSGPYFPGFGLNTERYKVSQRSISPYSVRMWENTDQNNSEYEHFSRSVSCCAKSCFTWADYER